MYDRRTDVAQTRTVVNLMDGEHVRFGSTLNIDICEKCPIYLADG
jgi:hypothetical protein